ELAFDILQPFIGEDLPGTAADFGSVAVDRQQLVWVRGTDADAAVGEHGQHRAGCAEIEADLIETETATAANMQRVAGVGQQNALLLCGKTVAQQIQSLVVDEQDPATADMQLGGRREGSDADVAKSKDVPVTLDKELRSQWVVSLNEPDCGLIGG